MGIVGVGLIGGSIALAARKHAGCQKVIGLGRNLHRLQQAQQLGILDEATSNFRELSSADLVIVCTPVDRIVEDVTAVLRETPDSTLVTDAGSVKARICENLRALGPLSTRFVGSHPLAGSHRSGFENADADLFVNRKCVVTPDFDTNSETSAAISRFWRKLGMNVRSTSPQAHDRVLALTSHLPHLAAAAVAGLVGEEEVEFAATGYGDTTRVAGGDPDLWTAIFSENSAEVVAATDLLIDLLTRYRRTLVDQDRAALQHLLTVSQRQRRAFDETHNAPTEVGESP